LHRYQHRVLDLIIYIERSLAAEKGTRVLDVLVRRGSTSVGECPPINPQSAYNQPSIRPSPAHHLPARPRIYWHVLLSTHFRLMSTNDALPVWREGTWTHSV